MAQTAERPCKVLAGAESLAQRLHGQFHLRLGICLGCSVSQWSVMHTVAADYMAQTDEVFKIIPSHDALGLSASEERIYFTLLRESDDSGRHVEAGADTPSAQFLGRRHIAAESVIKCQCDHSASRRLFDAGSHGSGEVGDLVRL
nr:hypothetical protein [Microlunatus sp. Gsoil 973]